jgi:hypothetical protein
MQPVQVPIRYQEASAMGVAFPASAERLRQLTPAPLKVVESWPGRAPVGVMAFDYTQSDVGPYGEVAICWPVVDSRVRPPPLLPLLLEGRWPGAGWWVRHLPVTTEIALSAGRSLWGYPKFLASIEFSWRGSTRTCTLREGGSEILRLSIGTRMPARPQRIGVTTYSILDGDLLATRIEVDAVGLRRPLRGDASLVPGPHPIGRELLELGLSLARPLEVRWFPTWRAVLPAARSRRPVEPGVRAGAPARDAA